MATPRPRRGYSAETGARLRYSTPHEADCRRPFGGCAWRPVETVVQKNATCANDKIHAAIEAYAGEGSCFDPLGPVYNRTSDEYIECVVQTVTGRDPMRVDRKVSEPMTAAQLRRPLELALTLDDESKGGCPAVSSDHLFNLADCDPTCGGYDSGTCCNGETCVYLPGPVGAWTCQSAKTDARRSHA